MSLSRTILLSALLAGGIALPAAAQLQPPSTGGIVALEQELRMLGHNKRVLMIGAHPDDEDTELLTLLVRGMGAEAAYLSLNRGEGGQNLIGPELGEGLGLIRTEELLAARRLDGARQFFTRAYDFGFSKTLEETWRFWPRDSVLKDVVRIVRQFRPQIIVSIFSGTPRDGHGQHQAAGWAAREVFKVASDSTVFPGLGEPWRPLKLYQSTRFDSAATTLALEGGALDPILGQTYRQIAMRGRSYHRSQDMGQLQRIGPSQIRVRLIEDRTGNQGPGLWDGVDTLLPTRCGVFACGALSPIVGLDQQRHSDLANAIRSGIVLDAVANDDRVVPGQLVQVSTIIWNGSDRPHHAQRILYGGLPDVVLFNADGDGRVVVGPGAADTLTVTVRIADDASPAQPYFLRRPRVGALYYWEPEAPSGTATHSSLRDSASPWGRWNGLPFEDPLVTMLVHVDGDRDSFDMRREVSYRVNNQAYGEVRRPVIIVPRIDVKLDPGTELWSTAPGPHDFTVTLTNGARDSTSGTVTLELPAGWPAATPQRFEFSREDEHEAYRFVIRPPANLRPGSYDIRAVATDRSGQRYDQGVYTVDYPHITPRSWTRSAAARINVAPLELAHLKRVGYIRGAADMVPEALMSVGVPVELLDRTTLERGDLSRFDAIVVGSRAYETDSALVENNGRLLAYARNGGLVIVQYQQQVYFNGGFAPYKLTVGGQQIVMDSVGGTRVGPLIGHDRVTDETAPVKILDPANPVVNRSNKIGPGDWNGWVQERGLYFAHTWDDAYKPVLEMADPGEAPLRGSLLVAKVGKGTYVYTGLSFFRELPAGVPGAFRLFANLLALSEGVVP